MTASPSPLRTASSPPARPRPVLAALDASKAAVTALALTIVATAIVVTLPRHGVLAHSAADDAFYYLAIARRAGDARWPSFDGVHTTTGFHPLWLFVLVPFAKWIASPWVFLRVASALSSGLMIAASISMARLFGRIWGAAAGSVATVLLLASPGAARFGWMAMEGPLALPHLSFFLAEVFRAGARPVVIGALAGLAILARLDMVIVIAVALGWQALVRRALPIRGVVVAGYVAAATIAPYVAWNVALTGHAATISSATKSFVVDDAAKRDHGGRLTTGFVVDVARDALRVSKDMARLSPLSVVAGPIALAGRDHPSAVDTHEHRTSILIFSLVAVATGLFHARKRGAVPSPSARPDYDLLAVLGIASAAHVAAACVLLVGQSGPWYWGLEIVTVAAAASYASARWQGARRAAAFVSAVAVTSMAMLYAGLAAGRIDGRFDTRASFSSVMVDLDARLATLREPDDAAETRGRCCEEKGHG